ncbi:MULTISPECIES: hypothetical protein [unclassified Stenotrophomonas]|uniref:hypothetical protein n=1 Tax=unclassified Stenotrophomonas TaxID=196198 RepID=UPI000D16A2D0|nr:MULTISPECIES: hypothetical protein [unclassified Stenotrophomonas]PTA73264.1 hypothetical protein C9412_00680 [Stenotrophomonas sp. Nf1]PTA83357.1 hypothetical protein C9416_01870 [Stenotrophomonas sp. Nf4]
MITALSALLWFISQHPLLTFFAAMVLAGLVSWWRRSPVYAIAVFPLAMLNIFLGSFLNATFLNAVGERGVAVIVKAEETSSTLNEQYIWRYEAVLRTAEGRDVEVVFHTNTAALWPLENTIRIPAQDQPFVVKYTPGFPRNFVILTDESPHGIAQARASARERVEVAARKLHFSPGNADFRADYRRELQTWLRDQGDDPQQQTDAQRYRAELDALDR